MQGAWHRILSNSVIRLSLDPLHSAFAKLSINLRLRCLPFAILGIRPYRELLAYLSHKPF